MSTESGPRRSRSWWIAWPVTAVVLWAGSIIWIGGQIGVAGVALGVAISIPITVVIVSVFLWVGQWTRGRPRLLVSAFVWGACIATFGAIWSQQWLHAMVDAIWGTGVGEWVRPLIITPITEEVLKGLFLVWLLVYRRREIAGVVDAVVYAGLAGAGFSFTENILYLGRPLSDVFATAGSDAAAMSVLGVTLFLRVLLVPFFHSLMVVLTGLGVGIAANARGGGARAVPVVTGLLAATILHGVWDWAGLASSDRFLIFKIYGAVMVPLFIVVLVVTLVARRRQARVIVSGIPMLVAHGDVAADEGVRLRRLRERRRWRSDVRRRSGIKDARATGRYQVEASALAIRIVGHRIGDREQLHAQRRVTARARSAVDFPQEE